MNTITEITSPLIDSIENAGDKRVSELEEINRNYPICTNANENRLRRTKLNLKVSVQKDLTVMHCTSRKTEDSVQCRKKIENIITENFLPNSVKHIKPTDSISWRKSCK